jgi:putative ABC transport system ATP-binding protein
MILEVSDLTKSYQTPTHSLTVLDHVSFSVQKGDVVAVVGPSGSGKTTLLGLCAGLDRATSGSVILNEIRLDILNEDERADIRNRFVGFVFQNFQLIPTLTALENVMVPLELRGEKGAAKRALDWLDRVGLADRHDHYPSQLSGGEQQRVALARAFSNEPLILFVDEPTGNLDEETGKLVEQLLFDLNGEAGTTLILVTHDLELADKAQRVIQLRGGKVVKDTGKRMGVAR